MDICNVIYNNLYLDIEYIYIYRICIYIVSIYMQCIQLDLKIILEKVEIEVEGIRYWYGKELVKFVFYRFQ